MTIREEMIRAGVLKPNRNGYQAPRLRRRHGTERLEDATALLAEDDLPCMSLDEVGKAEAARAIVRGPIKDWQLRKAARDDA